MTPVSMNSRVESPTVTNSVGNTEQSVFICDPLLKTISVIVVHVRKSCDQPYIQA